MREKELRLALICYGGISLAVYMHGITKEIWRLVRASQAFHDGDEPADGSQGVYHRLLQMISEKCDLKLRVIVDILTGASAGGINAIFLAEAISSGQSLDPLTDLWLEKADVDILIDPDVSPMSRVVKAVAIPFTWAYLARQNNIVEQTVEEGHRREIRAKLANFVRARWFNPPFGGALFTNLLIDALEAMANGPKGPPLLPDYQPLDLFVTVTDFYGHPQRLRLHSPAETMEIEHRLILSLRDPGGVNRHVATLPGLAYAARATASFPGAFPPFRVDELDKVLKSRKIKWPERTDFLNHALPRRAAIGKTDSAVFIDGSVLANAPFRPAIDALQNRPTRREVDRRFVYIDPKPGTRSISFGVTNEGRLPGFFTTLFASLSDIPREQPIRDNLEAIEQRSSRIRQLQHILQAMRPEVEATIEQTFGTAFTQSRPTPKQLARWRTKAQNVAAREAGYAYAAYGHLKLSAVVEDMAQYACQFGWRGKQPYHEKIRKALWTAMQAQGVTADDAMTAKGAKIVVIEFLRNFDIGFRTRRLRFVVKLISELEEQGNIPHEVTDQARITMHDLIGKYRTPTTLKKIAAADRARIRNIATNPEAALDALANIFHLKAIDDESDERLAVVLGAFPKAARRTLILAYLGYPFYDITTLPLLQGEGLDEFDPIKVDRIAPDDAPAIRKGGAAATLKGIQFNSFGAFFSRAYRENDYLWGRLHGAERMIDITISALPDGKNPPPGVVAMLKRDIFRFILAEERPRLKTIQPLFDEIEKEIG
jgi:patatin-related protein